MLPLSVVAAVPSQGEMHGGIPRCPKVLQVKSVGGASKLVAYLAVLTENWNSNWAVTDDVSLSFLSVVPSITKHVFPKKYVSQE